MLMIDLVHLKRDSYKYVSKPIGKMFVGSSQNNQSG